MYVVDTFCFDKYFKLFKKFIEYKDGAQLISFLSSHFLEKEEGYKDEIYRKGRKKLKYWNWKETDIGSGKIFKAVIASIKLEKNLNNLVDWRLADKFEEKKNNKEKLKSYEEAFFYFYKSKSSDQKSFNTFIEQYGKNYPLLAYFFFIKDKAKYLPISSTRLDESINKLGVVDFKTGHKCSWQNYMDFIDLVKQVKELLSGEGLEDVSLLNSHSFIWILSERRDQMNEVDDENNKLEGEVVTYSALPKKEKEAVIKARTGQGLFRDQLLGYWKVCCLTGCKKQDLLIASHIKPFKDCNDREAIDVYNGLLLSPNLDKLFNQGFISFNDIGEIIISSQLDKHDIDSLGIASGMVIVKIEEEHKKFFKYHRKEIFKK